MSIYSSFGPIIENESRITNRLCNRNNTLVIKGAPGEVEGMAFDPVERRLFWTDGSKQSIHRLQLDADGASSNATGAVEVLHFLSGDKPRGLATHHCRRSVFYRKKEAKDSITKTPTLLKRL